MKTKKVIPGFSVTEVLLVLSFLGVISTFLLPKILLHLGEHEKITTFRQSIAVMQTLLESGMLRNDLNPTNINTYFLDKVNATHKCYSDSSREGCWPVKCPLASDGLPEKNCAHSQLGQYIQVDSWKGKPVIINELDQSGFVLPNGAVVSGLTPNPNPTDSRYKRGEWGDAIQIDWDGAKGKNVFGDDRLWLTICYGSVPCDQYPDENGNPQPSGTIVSSRRNNYWDGVSNQKLWDHVFESRL